ncbi:hypothetical protein [Cellulophaga sp. Asnod2-G02]|uniref:hypothetical protein n=1 Tax=Cellulophaga sp. Asnod2-G02 TaxID=3160572 RepID=UPI00387042BF
MKILGLLFLLFTTIVFSQEDYFNKDGSPSNVLKREVFVESFKANDHTDMFDLEDKFFVIITKLDFSDEKFDEKELQERVIFSSFYQLHEKILYCRLYGYKHWSNVDFDGIIFKTNTIYKSNTRRYHFKFTFNELNSLPEYIDQQELYNYVVENDNIIHVKNSKTN